MQTPGPLEILVILVIALLVFGPNKLPEIGKQVGKAVREFKRFQASFNDEVRDFVDPDKPVPSRWAGQAEAAAGAQAAPATGGQPAQGNRPPSGAPSPPSGAPSPPPGAPSPPPAAKPTPPPPADQAGEVVDAEIVSEPGTADSGEGGPTDQPRTT